MTPMSLRSIVLRWLPALAMMLAIFSFSSLPAARIPYFGDLDIYIKKGGHFLGYALLAVAYFWALPPRLPRGFRGVLSILMAMLFALSDEFHQSFVEGRTSSLRDVAIDTFGAAVAVALAAVYSSNSRSRPDA
jgi:VanZ family protein